MTQPKVVVALYPFKAIESGDLSLEKVSIVVVLQLVIDELGIIPFTDCHWYYAIFSMNLTVHFYDDSIFVQGAEYEILDDSQEHWWKVVDRHGAVGYIPSNYVKEKDLLGLQNYELVFNVSFITVL